MSFLTRLKDSIRKTNMKFSRQACYFCKRKTGDLRAYRNERNDQIKVCYLCLEYAHRRAYRKM